MASQTLASDDVGSSSDHGNRESTGEKNNPIDTTKNSDLPTTMRPMVTEHNPTTPGMGKVSFQLARTKATKVRSEQSSCPSIRSTTHVSAVTKIQNELGHDTMIPSSEHDTSMNFHHDEPLVIPALSNRRAQRSTNARNENHNIDHVQPTMSLSDLQSTSMSEDDIRAVHALLEPEQRQPDKSPLKLATDSTIGNSRFEERLAIGERESRQLKEDLETLPDEIPIDSNVYSKVPIAEFGAALLRGMGWTGDNDNKDNQTKKKTDDVLLPRPSRLGLGATPKMVEPDERKKRLRPDQFRQSKAVEQQQAEYMKERERQKALDRQITLQNDSLVLCSNGRRARILKLVGVPGLNRVQVQFESDTQDTIIPRDWIDRLLSRDELEQNPFRHVELEQTFPNRRDDHHDSVKPLRVRGEHLDSVDRKLEKRPRRMIDGPAVKVERGASRHPTGSSSNERVRSVHSSWLVPEIRVRVVTEKLGKCYFKQKAVVVDVTPKGATLQMENGMVLDRVPERYLQTALPKAGGLVYVLNHDSRVHTVARLLERNSRTGVVQFTDDMNVMTLPLDDLAEWCPQREYNFE